MAKRYELSDWEWERIENLFPSSKTGRPPKWDNKTMLNAILWLARSGSAWEDIPNRYPPHQSVYSRFCKWRDDGTLEASKSVNEIAKLTENILNIAAQTNLLALNASIEAARAEIGRAHV